MPVHLIIDGYNLLGRRGPRDGAGVKDGETARERLLRDLAGYGNRKAHRMTVVFDAWQRATGTGHREHRSGVEVLFTRPGERADQVIQRLAMEYGRECAVVSSDREVADFAKAHGAFVMSAAEFDAKLRSADMTPAVASLEKEDTEAGTALSRRRDKKGNPRKLSKAIRTRNRRLGRF